LSGLICNRVGSVGHLELLRRAASGTPVLGGLLKHAAPSFPERHLGLWAATELDLQPSIEAWADQVEAGCDVEALIGLARSAPPLSAPLPAAPAQSRRCRIGVARDEAFHFYYEANLHLLEQAGAELVPFSPLHDPELGGVDGVYIGGGYPELYAAQLSSNVSLQRCLRALAAEGAPIYAEGGGLMYLSSSIVTLDGSEHPMLGLIDGVARMSDKLQALGYVEVETRTQTPLGPPGTRFRGHQFRYSRFDSPSEPRQYDVRVGRTGLHMNEGYGSGQVIASYVHAHWASNPEIPVAFVASCSQRRASLGPGYPNRGTTWPGCAP
jgi:cobyrinic acid a,c-diamide synthase